MAKNQQAAVKEKPETPAEARVAVETPKPAAAEPAPPIVSNVPAKKEAPPNRPKKPAAAASKGNGLVPSETKLEHLKAAVESAGDAEKLLTILQHVEDAGGRVEVIASIEAYRALKKALGE